MRKLLIIFSILFVFFSTSLLNFANDRNFNHPNPSGQQMTWQIRETPFLRISTNDEGEVTETHFVEYTLYYGNRDTLKFEKFLSNMKIIKCSYMYRANPRVVKERKMEETQKYWYFEYFDTTSYIHYRGALFEDKRVWNHLSPLIRHTMIAFNIHSGFKLIVYNEITSSIAIYFRPKYDRNRKYYERKLKHLKWYLEKLAPKRNVTLAP